MPSCETSSCPVLLLTVAESPSPPVRHIPLQVCARIPVVAWHLTSAFLKLE